MPQPENRPTPDPSLAPTDPGDPAGIPGPPPQTASRLRAELSLFSALMLVIGAVIGSGIFFKPQAIAEDTAGHLGLILLLWLVCGVVNLCGALTLAELAAMFPHAGGTYVYLREAYGRLVGFLWAWAEFWVIRSGSIAALATVLALAIAGALEGTQWQVAEKYARVFELGVAGGAILLLTLVNVLGVWHGGVVQNLTTIIKGAFMVLLMSLPFLATQSEVTRTVSDWPSAWDKPLWQGIGAALAAIMWAYDGWGNVTVVSEEIRQPQRNVPLALGGGVLAITVLYLGAVYTYHTMLSLETITSHDNAAMPVMILVWGKVGGQVLSAMLMVSLFGALNSNILVGPRVLYAVGRDHPRLAALAHVDPQHATPKLSIVSLSAWSFLLLIVGNYWRVGEERLFDVMTNYCVFGGSLFYLAAVAAVFVFRVTRPNAIRAYRTWGYPIVPLVFVVFYVLLLYGMLMGNGRAPLAALILVATGLACYPLLKK